MKSAPYKPHSLTSNKKDSPCLPCGCEVESLFTSMISVSSFVSNVLMALPTCELQTIVLSEYGDWFALARDEAISTTKNKEKPILTANNTRILKIPENVILDSKQHTFMGGIQFKLILGLNSILPITLYTLVLLFGSRTCTSSGSCTESR